MQAGKFSTGNTYRDVYPAIVTSSAYTFAGNRVTICAEQHRAPSTELCRI